MKAVNRYRLILLIVGGLFTGAVQAQELAPGTTMPLSNHSLMGVDGSQNTLASLTGSSGTVFIFWSNQCPWVDKYKDRIVDLHQSYSSQGINFVLVNANDPEAFPQEAPDVGRRQKMPMPYVSDPGSQLAKALGASRTPHVFAFDASQTLAFVGAIDDSPGDPSNVEEAYLDDALKAIAGGGAVSRSQTKAFGCRIKLQQ